MSIEQKCSKEESLKKSLKTLLSHNELKLHRQLLERLSKEMHVSVLDCAAALSLLTQQGIFAKDKPGATNRSAQLEQLAVSSKQKLVRYRLDIGRKHKVSLDEIRKVLVEVSGVDKKGIGHIDIRNFYTLVDLPDGMTADIFQLLSETEVNEQRLNIKRVKYQRRFHRRSNKKT